MAKTKEELSQLKSEYELLANKLKELSEDELKYVAGGLGPDIESADYDNKKIKEKYLMAA